MKVDLELLVEWRAKNLFIFKSEPIARGHFASRAWRAVGYRSESNTFALQRVVTIK